MDCECLAAWVDSEPCICNEPIGAPMEVSATKLATANRLVSEIKAMDYALTRIKNPCRTRVEYGNNDCVYVSLPPDIATAMIRTMRFHALVKLAETGVVSTWTGHRPVVSA